MTGPIELLNEHESAAREVREVAAKANPGLAVVQLYRDYLLNFMINKRGDGWTEPWRGARRAARPRDA